MRRKRFGLFAVTAALLMVGALAATVDAAPVTFGAKLTNESQPANAESGQTCHQNAPGVPKGGICTWVSTTAFENGSHFKAPKAGTIAKLKLVSCIAGSFTLQIARANPSTNQARVVRNGPTIHYSADPRQVDGNPDTFCGGDDGTDYIVQTFSVNVHVNTGDFIAVRAAKLGTLHCSGGSSPMLFFPALAAGGSLRHETNSASCDLLVTLIYA
jgi:hypothetical protein